jgi:hypothetical protein
MMDDITIYGLVDPRNGHIRYIGQTMKPKTRLAAHCSDVGLAGAVKKAAWIKELKEVGMKPQLLELENVPVDEANSCESFYIDYFKMLGADLTNGRKYSGYSLTTRKTNAARPPKIAIPLTLSKELVAAVREMAKQERRSFNNQLLFLMSKALKARGRL